MKDIVNRTFDFATRIVRLCNHLDQRYGVARTLSRQLLRAGTSSVLMWKKRRPVRVELIS